MSMRAATPELIGHQVREVLEQRPDAEAIALRAEPIWTAGSFIVDGRSVVVQPCTSPLAVRAALTDWGVRPVDAANGDTHRPDQRDVLIVLCDLTDADLGADVLARFTPARVLGLEPWNAVKGLFGVRHLDAAFGKEDAWIADALLAYVPEHVARSMTGGAVLTVDVALDALATAVFGAEGLDVDAVLSAAVDPSPFAALAAATPVVRDGLLDALRRRHGPLGAIVSAALAAGRGSDLLALGLTARTVYGRGEHDGGRAAGHLEAQFGGVRIDPGVGAAFAQRCEEVVARLFATDRIRANVIVAESAAIASQIDASHPEDSDFLPEGFDRRVAIAAGVIATTLDALPSDPGSGASPAMIAAAAAIAAAVDRVETHRLGSTPAGRTREAHLDMAARLTAWLTTPLATADSFEAGTNAYAASSAWVDYARRRLWRGDGDPEVGATYRRVLDAVVARRRIENKAFAERLAAWTQTPSSGSTRTAAGVVAVEDVAQEVLAPLARHTPLLFIVLDGCGLASFTELAPQLTETGYREVTRAATHETVFDRPGSRLVGIAALPTVTEVSRASLIAGQLDHGNQEHERRAFEANAALRIHGVSAAFFHQNKLLGAAGAQLSLDVERALGPAGPAVVGVVINTIDDHLKRGTFPERLRLEDLHALVALLDVARTHGRTVVVSADHGHVLAQPEDGGAGVFQGGGEGGERWRVADRAPTESEVVLRGDRVLLAGDAGIIAPFDDDFRYGAKAGGYHGGATPEEVLVPVAVFTAAGIDAPSGWEYATQAPPLWWDLLVDQPFDGGSAAKAPAAKPSRKPKPVDPSQVPMFDVPASEAVPAQASPSRQPAWIGSLLASDIWKLQKSASGRAQLPEDRVGSVLVALQRRGGVGSLAAIAADTGMPIGRLPGFLAHLSRVLNVDGYAVLDVDAVGSEVRLSVALLAQQFEISVDAT